MTRFLLLALCPVLVVACDDFEGTPRSLDGLAPEVPAYGPLPDGVDLGAEFEAMFCPDDPVITLELKLIDGVREALALDGGAYDEGTNPFAIRYAVYNLRNEDVVEHLVAAHDEGVDVQVLMEADQLDPERTWNWADERLVDAGFEFVEDHRDLTDDQLFTADLVGIAGSGLMHLKTRLFTTSDGTSLLTGSMNPGDNAVHNDETLHLINDARIVDRYIAAFDAVLADGGLQNSWDDGEAVNVLFTPADSGPRAVSQVLKWVSDEDEQILLMVYSLRDLTAPDVSDSLVEILADKAAAGVPVYVITDRKQSDGYWDPTEDDLRAAGIHVWEVNNFTTAYTAMHHKVAVLGKTDIRVITDAGNWSKSAMGSSSEIATNVESVLFVDSSALDHNRTGHRYMAQWMRVLHRYADQGEPEGEPDFWFTHATLTQGDDWPSQDVTFVAQEVYTDWGEYAYVRGDLPELGTWGLTNSGVQLSTDGHSYPTWTSSEPTQLPLGTPMQWKLVAGYEGVYEVRWESGLDRFSFAQPPALTGADVLELTATWRD